MYESGCLMVEVPIKNWDKLKEIIDEEDILDEDEDQKGFEDEPHITVLYGIDPELSLGEVLGTPLLNLPKCKDIEISLKRMSVFENDDFDVLHFECESDELRRQNSVLVCQVDNDNKFPEYKAHMTIAYLKKGTGKKYLKKYNKSSDSLKFNPRRYIYTKPGFKEFFN